MKWLVAGAAMAVGAGLVGVPAPAAAVPGGCDPNFEIVDHRGALKERDENTLPAIRVGARRGESIEIDVRATSDGVNQPLILMHDRTFTRTTTNGDGLVVAETDFATARTLLTDHRQEMIPTLDEALTTAAPFGVDVYLDVKDRTDGVLLEVIDTIRAHEMTDRAFVTSWTGKMVTLTKDNPNILLQDKPNGDAPDPAQVNYYVAKDIDSVSLHPRQMDQSPTLVGELRSLGIEVHSRLVSKEQAWDRVTQYPIQGALTNRPRLLTEYCSPPPS